MLVWLSVLSKVQTTLWCTYKLCDLHAIFIPDYQFQKVFFLCFLGNNFTVHCGGPWSTAQFAALPRSLNPALAILFGGTYSNVKAGSEQMNWTEHALSRGTVHELRMHALRTLLQFMRREQAFSFSIARKVIE